jgi:hypothetical protein
MAFCILLFPVIMQHSAQELPHYILKLKQLQENSVVMLKN